MKQRILAIIGEVQALKEEAHITPHHVLTSEIINRGCHNPYMTLNELVRDGKLRWHRTLNDVAFTINKQQ